MLGAQLKPEEVRYKDITIHMCTFQSQTAWQCRGQKCSRNGTVQSLTMLKWSGQSNLLSDKLLTFNRPSYSPWRPVEHREVLLSSQIVSAWSPPPPPPPPPPPHPPNTPTSTPRHFILSICLFCVIFSCLFLPIYTKNQKKTACNLKMKELIRGKDT